MAQDILTPQALEAVTGPTPEAMHLKVIDHLDEQARRWLAASPLAFAGFSDADGVDATLAGGEAGFASVTADGLLRMPREALDDAGQARPGRGAGWLFLVPGIGETLRINGAVAGHDGPDVLVDVLECYAHCAKALLRSGFWDAAESAGGTPPDDAQAFIGACRFLALVTADAAQHTDVSPKGDPAGALLCEDEAGLWLADRPGNRRMDGLRNMLSQPAVAALALVPGCGRVALLHARARVSADPGRRQALAVQGKQPKVVALFEAPRITLYDSPALARAGLWSGLWPDTGIDPAQVFAAHVGLNRQRGLRAALARGLVRVPGLMRKGLEQDYKRNLY